MKPEVIRDLLKNDPELVFEAMIDAMDQDLPSLLEKIPEGDIFRAGVVSKLPECARYESKELMMACSLNILAEKFEEIYHEPLVARVKDPSELMKIFSWFERALEDNAKDVFFKWALKKWRVDELPDILG